MKKNYNVSIEDNGAGFLIVIIGSGTGDRLVVKAFSTLGESWRHIMWMYQIESQEFTVGKKEVPVTEWINGMKQAGYLD